jgi:tripartite ATP-independent transporter DctM subunit
LEWYTIFLIIFGSLMLLFITGMPIAFCFMVIDMVAALVFWGGQTGLEQLIVSFSGAVTTFTLLAIPLFILMGEVMFQSGVAPQMINAIDKWLGRIPGRLSLLSVGAGTILASLTGASVASVALLGTILVPDMEKRGYKKSMTLGAILGSGGLAIMIPPSALGVLLAVVGKMSVGRLLLAIIVPGLLMAALYAIYIILRCYLQPSVAPAYEVRHTPLPEKLVSTALYILPLGIIIFLVTGVIFWGLATPSEAAATGAIGTFILAACYRRLSWNVVKKSFIKTFEITVMFLTLLVGATAFSQVLGFSGASQGLAKLAGNLSVSPLLIVVAMQLVILFLGCFMNTGPVIMITIPFFMPVIEILRFDPIWFGAITLINIEMALSTPPFGMSLFVMKSVAPPETTMKDVYLAGLPFLLCDAVAIALIIAFPALALWLPSFM